MHCSEGSQSDVPFEIDTVLKFLLRSDVRFQIELRFEENHILNESWQRSCQSDAVIIDWYLPSQNVYTKHLGIVTTALCVNSTTQFYPPSAHNKYWQLRRRDVAFLLFRDRPCQPTLFLAGCSRHSFGRIWLVQNPEIGLQLLPAAVGVDTILLGMCACVSLHV